MYESVFTRIGICSMSLAISAVVMLAQDPANSQQRVLLN